MWTIAAVFAPGRDTYFYRAYAAEFPNVFGYRFHAICTVEDETEAVRIVDGLEQRRMRAKWRKRKVA